ncbi:FMN-binding protein, partial [Rudaea sp.]|uniref:FMN-binding protein n=1 Tax=Rudaea sp. TaxID=2136325 RepID=UPI002ED39839
MQIRWLIPLGAAAASQAAFATQYLSVQQAQQEAFPAAGEFRAAPAPDAATAASIGAPAGWAPQIFEARAGEKKLGWLIVDQVIGKSEAITYALALDAAGAVVSLEVLEYRESHGGEVRMPAWRKQFVGKTAGEAAALNREIKIISGATLSCRHLTEGVQRLLRLYEIALKASA